MIRKRKLAIVVAGVLLLAGVTLSLSMNNLDGLKSDIFWSGNRGSFVCTPQAVLPGSRETKQYTANLVELQRLQTRRGVLQSDTNVVNNTCKDLKGRERYQCQFDIVELRTIENRLDKLNKVINAYQNCKIEQYPRPTVVVDDKVVNVTNNWDIVTLGSFNVFYKVDKWYDIAVSAVPFQILDSNARGKFSDIQITDSVKTYPCHYSDTAQSMIECDALDFDPIKPQVSKTFELKARLWPNSAIWDKYQIMLTGLWFNKGTIPNNSIIGPDKQIMNIEVTPPVVGINGACGTANGTTVSTIPTTNLCSTGTATTPTGDGPWNWTCAGLNGGTTASCSAPKITISDTYSYNLSLLPQNSFAKHGQNYRQYKVGLNTNDSRVKMVSRNIVGTGFNPRYCYECIKDQKIELSFNDYALTIMGTFDSISPDNFVTIEFKFYDKSGTVLSVKTLKIESTTPTEPEILITRIGPIGSLDSNSYAPSMYHPGDTIRVFISQVSKSPGFLGFKYNYSYGIVDSHGLETELGIGRLEIGNDYNWYGNAVSVGKIPSDIPAGQYRLYVKLVDYPWAPVAYGIERSTYPYFEGAHLIGYPSDSFMIASSAVFNGACGTANGTTVSTIPTTNLCSTGTATTPTGSGPWNWTCAGSNGGTTASCLVNKTVVGINGACGTANGTTVSTIPTTNLCSFGTASPLAGSGPWTWTCPGDNGGAIASCSANKTVVVVNAICGTAHGTTVFTAPTTNLCSVGTDPTVTGSGPWSWTCYGSGTGHTNASCSANKTVVAVNGACGTANGTTVSTIPTTNLCSTGTATTPTGDGPWNWTCAGLNGGTTASCSVTVISPNGGGQVSYGPTMEGYFTVLKNNGLTDESRRATFIQTIWNNWSKTSQFTADELTAPPFIMADTLISGPFNIDRVNTTISITGNLQKLYITGHGVNGAYMIGTQFDYYDGDKVECDSNNFCPYPSSTFYKPFFTMLISTGAVNSAATTTVLRDLYNLTFKSMANGACNPVTNGVTLYTTPTASLCSMGLASAVSGSGPWTWKCAGFNGGTTASCSST